MNNSERIAKLELSLEQLGAQHLALRYALMAIMLNTPACHDISEQLEKLKLTAGQLMADNEVSQFFCEQFLEQVDLLLGCLDTHELTN